MRVMMRLSLNDGNLVADVFFLIIKTFRIDKHWTAAIDADPGICGEPSSSGSSICAKSGQNLFCLRIGQWYEVFSYRKRGMWHKPAFSPVYHYFFPFAFDKSALEIPYLLHRYSYWIAPIISSASISGKAPITIARRVKNTAAGDHFSRQVSHLLTTIKILTKTTNKPKSNNPIMNHLSSCCHSKESGQPEWIIKIR